MSALTRELGGGEGVISLLGVGGMEVSENRSFIIGVVDGLRKLGASREATRRSNAEEGGGDDDGDSEDDDMAFGE